MDDEYTKNETILLRSSMKDTGKIKGRLSALHPHIRHSEIHAPPHPHITAPSSRPPAAAPPHVHRLCPDIVRASSNPTGPVADADAELHEAGARIEVVMTSWVR